MKVFFTVLGALVGAWTLDGPGFSGVLGGFIVGGCIGFLLATVAQLQQRLRVGARGCCGRRCLPQPDCWDGWPGAWHGA